MCSEPSFGAIHVTAAPAGLAFPLRYPIRRPLGDTCSAEGVILNIGGWDGGASWSFSVRNPAGASGDEGPVVPLHAGGRMLKGSSPLRFFLSQVVYEQTELTSSQAAQADWSLGSQLAR